MIGGWIKIHRCIRDHWIWEDAEKLKAWLDLLMMVNHEDKEIPLGGKMVTIKRGECLTSLVALSERWGRNRKTVRRFISLLEEAKMVSTERTAHGTTLKVLNYAEYQDFPEPRGTTNGTALGTSQGTTVGTTVGTQTINKELKNNNNIYIMPSTERRVVDQIIDYLNERSGKAFKKSSKKTVSLIRARLSEGFTEDDFKAVIDRKVSDWKYDDRMARYIRPETLFGTKFEGYLNEKGSPTEHPEQRKEYTDIVDFGL